MTSSFARAVKKKVAVCGNCLCRLGVTFDHAAIIPKLVCAGCEPFVTHQEEIRQAEGERYDAIARRDIGAAS